MDKTRAIFDMDGTLVDSMVYWKALAEEYLQKKGITELSPDLMERIKPMTISESAAYFIREFGFAETPESAAEEINNMMNRHYREDIPLKDGVQEYLRALQGRGIRMCVASATAKALMEACLSRLEVLDCFDFLLSCEEVGAGKQEPTVYFACADRWNAKPAEIAVYEDALYAAQTAKNAGFYTVGIWDASAEESWNRLTELCDEHIMDWRNAL